MKAWPVLRLVPFDHARVLAPWCLVRTGDSPVFRVRRIAHQLEEAGAPRPAAWERWLAHGMFLAVSARQILLTWKPEFRGVKRRYGIGALRQLRELIRLAWRGNLPPRVYYFHRLFKRDRVGQLSVIEHREIQFLLRALHARVDLTVLDDKIAFQKFAAQHNLPTPPILAVYERGALLGSAPADAAWRTDLFVKPARSYASIGVSAWKYDAATKLYTDGKLTLDLAQLQSWLAQQSRAATQVVQPRIGNAPDLLPITGSALANCRIITARRVDGSIFVLLAALRIGLGKAISSDDPVVMFCASVDRDTGTLSAGETKTASQGPFPQHPESGAPIAGRVLPRWATMRDLALRAHAAMPEMVFVGWDVVDTELGPMLLEGNYVWGGNLAQMAGNLPLGATEFSELFLQHYERLAHDAVEGAALAEELAATAASFGGRANG